MHARVDGATRRDAAPTGLPRCALIDDRSDPDPRTVYRGLVRAAGQVDAAVARIRIASLDFTDADLAEVASVRVLVGGLDMESLGEEARLVAGDETRVVALRVLATLLGDGRLQVRSSPQGGWAPDFSVFSGENGPETALVGTHWFQRPYPSRGPALASVHRGEEGRRLAERFEELWDGGHDVGKVVRGVLTSALDGASRTRQGP